MTDPTTAVPTPVREPERPKCPEMWGYQYLCEGGEWMPAGCCESEGQAQGYAEALGLPYRLFRVPAEGEEPGRVYRFPDDKPREGTENVLYWNHTASVWLCGRVGHLDDRALWCYQPAAPEGGK